MWNYALLLLIVVCPLMMIFMMGGMGGMRGGHDTRAVHGQSPQNRPPSRSDAEASQRIGNLERQVAELRAERDPSDGPARRP
ncbi:MAG: DUF2933 domain-containing protein [Ornithinibacter sp.]